MLTLSYTGRYWIKRGVTYEGLLWNLHHYDKNNIYLVGENTTTKNAIIEKIDIGGNCQWKRELGDDTNRTVAYGLDTDSYGNLYVAVTTFYETDGDLIIAKYNSSGILQWKKKLNSAGSNTASSLHIDSSNNIYVVGSTNQSGAGGSDVLIIKLDSSENILWQKTLGLSLTDEFEYASTLDSNGNLIISILNSDDIIVAKYNSSGTLQWQRKFGNVKTGQSQESAPSIKVDSNDNIYVLGWNLFEYAAFGSTSISYRGILIKYNSSGVIQWQKSIIPQQIYQFEYIFFSALAIDSNDNLYIAGDASIYPTQNTFRRGIYIAKLNTSGSVQWQRILYSGDPLTTWSTTPCAISIDEYDDLCISGYTRYSLVYSYTRYWPFIIKLPSDGSLTGMHDAFKYDTASVTYQNGSYPESAASLIDSSSSFTFTESTLTDSALSCSYDTHEISDSSESLTIGVEENIITSNLQIHLDAINKDSYSGSGTAWIDLMGNRNGTLRNGPSYDGESIVFDGSNDTVTFSQYDFGNEFTLFCFIKPSIRSNITTLFANSSSGFSTNGFRLFFNFENQNTRTLHIEIGNGSSGFGFASASNTIIYDTWQQVAFTLNKNTAKGVIYHNGISVKENNLNFTNYNTNAAFQFGTISGAYPYAGGMANYLIYNRALTASEIKQNYINQKGRFFGKNNISIF